MKDNIKSLIRALIDKTKFLGAPLNEGAKSDHYGKRKQKKFISQLIH